MADASRFAGTRVLVCGAGVAGTAAARALLGAGAEVLLADRDESGAVRDLTAAGVRYLGDASELPAGVDLVVTSPGWRPDHPLLASAAAAGVEVIGEVEFAWRLRGPGAAPWLAVTGTNGKTTTVRMLDAMLAAAGLRSAAVGNIGTSIIEAVLAGPAYDALAVELSSFQLYWSSTVRPAAGAVLNIAPDHLDWHGTMSDYTAAKIRIWSAPIAIGNVDDASVAALLEQCTSPTRVGVTLSSPHAGQLGVREGVLTDAAFAPAEALLPAAEVRPSGAHNVSNALAAAALARAHGVEPDAVAAGLRAFVPDPHRNQYVVEHDGVTWVDDSKATNPHAARASVLAYPRVVWIAGGQLKGAPVDDLVAEVADRLAGVVLLGVDRAQIAAALRRHAPDVPVIEVASTDDGAMTEVVHAAAGLARPGDVVLLAPAAASYDMFTGYAARGRAFCAAVASVAAAAGS